MKEIEVKEIEVKEIEMNGKEMKVEEKHQELVRNLMIFKNNIFICNKEINNGR